MIKILSKVNFFNKKNKLAFIFVHFNFSSLLGLYSLSQLLGAELDRESLVIISQLCQSGVNPEALSIIIQELKKEQQIKNQS